MWEQIRNAAYRKKQENIGMNFLQLFKLKYSVLAFGEA